ncbi:MAG: hypothetical protein LIO53_06650 [Oscillospiraceae bacterium]|nr:hypothetical protein [Oscillospiraceae bacterium]
MKYTTNYEMKLPEDTDELDVDVLDENFESIDGKIYSEAETRQTADETTASSSVKGQGCLEQ